MLALEAGMLMYNESHCATISWCQPCGRHMPQRRPERGFEMTQQLLWCVHCKHAFTFTGAGVEKVGEALAIRLRDCDALKEIRLASRFTRGRTIHRRRPHRAAYLMRLRRDKGIQSRGHR
jgi:hypothetical protein